MHRVRASSAASRESGITRPDALAEPARRRRQVEGSRLAVLAGLGHEGGRWSQVPVRDAGRGWLSGSGLRSRSAAADPHVTRDESEPWVSQRRRNELMHGVFLIAGHPGAPPRRRPSVRAVDALTVPRPAGSRSARHWPRRSCINSTSFDLDPADPPAQWPGWGLVAGCRTDRAAPRPCRCSWSSTTSARTRLGGPLAQRAGGPWPTPGPARRRCTHDGEPARSQCRATARRHRRLERRGRAVMLSQVT